jgi:hypothetical protein
MLLSPVTDHLKLWELKTHGNVHLNSIQIYMPVFTSIGVVRKVVIQDVSND